MLILGKIPNEKGEQLEILTKDLLQSLGYVNCTTNVMTGGAEIDVRGQFAIPSPNQTQHRTLICECKAHQTVVDMTQWNKFLGKIYFQEACEQQDVGGCFIALSGVNGHVQGNYDELSRHRKNISLIHGDELLKVVAKIYELSSLQSISIQIHNFTDRVIIKFEPAYYHKAIYWVVLFDQGGYTILNGVGATIPQETADNLTDLLHSETDVGNYINLQEEARAINRSALAKTILVATLFQNDGSISSIEKLLELGVTLLQNYNEAFSTTELRSELETLIKTGMLAIDSSNKCFIPTTEKNGEKLISIEVYRVLFTVACPITVLCSNYYYENINSALLGEICKIQGNLPLQPDQIHKAIQILRLSPTALANAIRPIEIITRHRNGNIDPNLIDKLDVDYFFRLMFDSLKHDFDTRSLHKYFHNVREIRELETLSEFILKDKSGIIIEGGVQLQMQHE